tara:strand:+ start:28 stop:219 length:192 start_codon:yes stop_codon:yes gene_type:complete
MIPQDEPILGQPIFQNPSTTKPSNEQGIAKPVFKSNQVSNAERIFGTYDQRANSMPQVKIEQF